MKTILKSYKFNGIFPFGDGEYYTSYTLTLIKTSWFGLVKKEVTQGYRVSMFENSSNCEKHWDNLIANKTKIV